MTSAYTHLEGGDTPIFRAWLISVPYSPSTAMAKTNCRKRRNKFAAKSGKGREVWMDIIFFYIQILCFRVYTKDRGGARGWARGGEDVGGLLLLEDIRGLEDGDVEF